MFKLKFVILILKLKKIICMFSLYSLQHQQHQQHIDEAENCSKESRSRVHVELQVYHPEHNAVLTNERQACL